MSNLGNFGGGTAGAGGVLGTLHGKVLGKGIASSLGEVRHVAEDSVSPCEEHTRRFCTKTFPSKVPSTPPAPAVVAKTLPHKPGVYKMIDVTGTVIYIGKAKDLFNRVGSYFRRNILDRKTQIMVSKICDIEWIVVGSEMEALVLEARLISECKPKYNILLREGMRVSYIRVTDERVEVARKVDREGVYFGPYHNGIWAGGVLDLIYDVFGVRDYVGDAGVVADIKKFLAGKDEFGATEMLTKRMEQASDMGQYEIAMRYRNGIGFLERLGEFECRVVEDAQENGGERVECFDISHFDGEFVVGGMSVFVGGMPRRDLYRRFKVRHGRGNDDFLSMREVVARRLARKDWGRADVIVIDGGLGQFNAVVDLFEGLDTRVISFTESVGVVSREGVEPFDQRNEEHKLYQRVRDEAHRYANEYRKHLQKRAMR